MNNQNATPKSVNILGRYVIKRTGLILYVIGSSNGKDKYFATVENGKVTAHDCPGYINHNHCYHVDYIHQAEAIAQYDVVGESLKVFNQTVAEMKIGNHYELVGAMHQAHQAELGSCDTCGYPVKPGFSTCGKCLGE